MRVVFQVFLNELLCAWTFSSNLTVTKYEKYMVFSLVLLLSVDVLLGIHTSVFLPWNLHQSNPLFSCSFGKTDQTCNMHKSRNKWWVYKQTTFLANMNSSILKSHRQCGTITQTECQESPLFTWLRYERIKHLMDLVKSNSRLLTSYSHTFLSKCCLQNLARKIFAYDKLTFYEFPKPEGWERTKFLMWTQTPFSHKKNSYNTKEDPLSADTQL